MNPAPLGVDAKFAWTVPGGDGTGVKIIDIEYAWNETHEDLSKAAGALIPNGTPVDLFNNDNHGTAVLGEMVADRNGFGVTGISYGAAVGMVNEYNSELGYAIPAAINLAASNLNQGDVMLLEMQEFGPQAPCTEAGQPFVPVEYVPANFDAILAATMEGIIVVEAAGNGGCDLDHALYLNSFNRALHDSGAIIVGAGKVGGCNFTSFNPDSPARSRLRFSSYGSRVDMQGWGECVVTTGLTQVEAWKPDLHDGPDKNHHYTKYFNGTSSASPIVAGAVADCQGMHKALRGIPMSPAVMRDFLVATGTPQDFSTDGGKIGPQPNLRACHATAVGGIAGVLDDARPSPAAASGSSTTPVAAMAATASSLVALAGGGWYARRRWMR